jgi:hypothetical protein
MRTKVLITVAIVTAIMFAGTAHADVLLSDNFEGEPTGLNYNSFANWTVTGGTVDMIGTGTSWNWFPGKYVDLDGSSSQAGYLTSKQSFVLPDGGTFTLSFDLAGSQRGDVNTVNVDLAGYSFGPFTVNGNDPFASHTCSLINFSGNPVSGTVVFHNLGGDNVGALLDNVTLTGPAQGVAEPTTLLLLGSGLIGLVGFRRRLKK